MSEWRLKMLACAKVIPEVWGDQLLTNTISQALIGGAKEIEHLQAENERFADALQTAILAKQNAENQNRLLRNELEALKEQT